LADAGVPDIEEATRGVASDLLIPWATGCAGRETDLSFQEVGHRPEPRPTAVGNKYRRAEENGLERENVRKSRQ
jgi:hypothetical protein